MVYEALWELPHTECVLNAGWRQKNDEIEKQPIHPLQKQVLALETSVHGRISHNLAQPLDADAKVAGDNGISEAVSPLRPCVGPLGACRRWDDPYLRCRPSLACTTARSMALCSRVVSQESVACFYAPSEFTLDCGYGDWIVLQSFLEKLRPATRASLRRLRIVDAFRSMDPYHRGDIRDQSVEACFRLLGREGDPVALRIGIRHRPFKEFDPWMLSAPRTIEVYRWRHTASSRIRSGRVDVTWLGRC